MFKQHVPKDADLTGFGEGSEHLPERESVDAFALRVALAAGVVQRCPQHPWTVLRGVAAPRAAAQLIRYEQALGGAAPVAFEAEVWAALGALIAQHARSVRCEECDVWPEQ